MPASQVERMRNALQRLRARLRLPAFMRRPARNRQPDTRQIGRTGDARYVPQIARWTQQGARVVCLANRYDDVSIRDYDRVRMYPVVRDALAMKRIPVTRANFHFACARQDIAELAQLLLAPLIPKLLDTLMRGGTEFGRQSVEIVWEPRFEIEVTSGQSVGERSGNRYYPFVWAVKRFNAFSPEDTGILIDAATGQFAGIRQFVNAATPEVPARKLLHFVHDQEFDSNFGIPATKPAVPFVEIAESVWDSMARYAHRFAVPITIGKHPNTVIPRLLASGETETLSAAAYMAGVLESIEAGHTVSLPSDVDSVSGQPKWDVRFEQPPGENSYRNDLEFLHQTIRIGLLCPEMASSSTPDSGTYNLGEAQIELFLNNIEAYLDQLAVVINGQLMPHFVMYNFGADAPECRIVFEPVDIKVRHALLSALLEMLASGAPIQDEEGNTYDADWPKLAEDNGVALKIRSVQSQAQAMREAIMKQLSGDPGDGESAANLSEVRLENPNRNPDGTFASSGGDQTGRSTSSSSAPSPKSGDAGRDAGNGDPPVHPVNRVGKIVDKKYLKDYAETLQDSGWTKGRKPTLVILDGRVWKVEPGAGAGEFGLIPATREDVMPAILKKIDDPGHRLSQWRESLNADAAHARPAPPTTPEGARAIDTLHSLTARLDKARAESPLTYAEKDRMHRVESRLNALASEPERYRNLAAISREKAEEARSNGWNAMAKKHEKYAREYEQNAQESERTLDSKRNALQNEYDALKAREGLPDNSVELNSATHALGEFLTSAADALSADFGDAVEAGEEPSALFFDTTHFSHATVAARYTKYGERHLNEFWASPAGRQVEERASLAADSYKESKQSYQEQDKLWKTMVGASGAQRDEATQQYTQIRERWLEARRVYDEAQQEISGIVRDHFSKVLSERHGHAGFGGGAVIEKGTKAWRTQVEAEGVRILSACPQRFRDAVNAKLGRVYYSTARAHYSCTSGGRGTIRVDDDPSTLAHELMHAVEHGKPDEGAISLRFLESRRKGEPIKALPGSSTERAAYDDFTDPYIGKYYNHGATEIMSMGIEGVLFGRYGILKGDPEMSAHVLGRLMRKG